MDRARSRHPPAAGGEPETFPPTYVEDLRAENASQRVRAQQADQLGAQPMRVTVASATGSILRNPADLLDGDYLDPATGLPDHDLIRQAAEQTASERPHLARARGKAGQGARPEGTEGFSLASAMRAAAR